MVVARSASWMSCRVVVVVVDVGCWPDFIGMRRKMSARSEMLSLLKHGERTLVVLICFWRSRLSIMLMILWASVWCNKDKSRCFAPKPARLDTHLSWHTNCCLWEWWNMKCRRFAYYIHYAFAKVAGRDTCRIGTQFWGVVGMEMNVGSALFAFSSRVGRNMFEMVSVWQSTNWSINYGILSVGLR